jgi:hypothetical protein
LRVLRHTELRCSDWWNNLSWCFDLLFVLFVGVLLLFLLFFLSLGWLLLLMVFNWLSLFNWGSNFNDVFNYFFNVFSFDDYGLSRNNSNLLGLDLSLVNNLALFLFLTRLAFFLLALWLLSCFNGSWFDNSNFTLNLSAFSLGC